MCTNRKPFKLAKEQRFLTFHAVPCRRIDVEGTEGILRKRRLVSRGIRVLTWHFGSNEGVGVVLATRCLCRSRRSMTGGRDHGTC